VRTEHVADREDATRAAIGRALADADLVLLSGGVSVGPHDHVKPALDQPGRPRGLLAGRAAPGQADVVRDARRHAGPRPAGNPASTMVTYLLFARPAILRMRGSSRAPRSAAPG
jgi:molybdopterin molybdotransferase